MQLLTHEGNTLTWLHDFCCHVTFCLRMWLYGFTLPLYIFTLFSIINDNLSTLHIVIKSYCVRLGLGCLTPLSTIFQLYRGCQFH